jgi:hypothetical protein
MDAALGAVAAGAQAGRTHVSPLAGHGGMCPQLGWWVFPGGRMAAVGSTGGQTRVVAVANRMVVPAVAGDLRAGRACRCLAMI